MTLAASFFDHLYGASPDPWDFRSRRYELRKRAVTLASLPEPHYSTVFEPGCSIGVLSEELAKRSDRVLSMDISRRALSLAAENVPSNVELRLGSVPAEWPEEAFDLVVLSEVGYYLSERDCRRLGNLAARSAIDLVCVHWRHPVEEYPLSGDVVHQILEESAGEAGMTKLAAYLEDDFRLDVWSHDARSVALRTDVPCQNPSAE